MDPAERMLRLLSLLQARPTWSGPELAGRLGVTDRTLRRDVTRLRSLGYPVEAMSGPGGGYELTPGGAIPPLLFDDDEAVVVALGVAAAATGGMPGFEDAALAALAKIDQVLPSRLRAQIADLEESTVRLGRPALASTRHDPGALVTIAQAARRGQRLRFGYVDGAGRTTERHVEPHRLVHAARRWYLVARDRDRDAWRTFRVDRIVDPVNTGMRFTTADPPDAAALVAEGLAVAVYRWQAKVLLRIPPDAAAEIISPTTGILEPAPGGTLLRIGADDLDWIARYLAALPCRFSVVEPAELEDAVVALATRIAEDARRRARVKAR